MKLDELLSAFEAGTVENDAFSHEAHVRVSWALIQRYGREEALPRLVAGIRGIAARAGRPKVFHETITRAWFELIARAPDLDSHPELFDRALLGRYYSTAALAAGRERWVEPDLHELVLPPPPEAPPAAGLEAVLRRVPTAVAVLATRVGDDVHATTVGSSTSVSRTPPLVSVCLANGSRTLDLLRESGAFALSFLAAGQAGLAERFADSARPSGPAQFAGVPHRLSRFGPIFDEAVAWIGCLVHDVHGCGDHSIVVGEVGFADTGADGHPLVRYERAFLG
jgi:flavin reductase (DIM6/NTAB) family NADH-FMN oxidoreductase RutF